MKPARLAVCQTKSDILTTAAENGARVACVERSMCGCTRTARIAARHGNLLDARIVDADGEHQAAEREGAMLSTCIEPLATVSPCIANFSSSSGGRGACSSALAATTAATAEAAEPAEPAGERNALVDRARNRSPASAPAAWRAAHDRRCSSRPRAACPARRRRSADTAHPVVGTRRARDAIAEHRPRSRGCRNRSRHWRPRPARTRGPWRGPASTSARWRRSRALHRRAPR